VTPSGSSQHPDDMLIRELIRARRVPGAEEVGRIRRRMATAPFLSGASLEAHVTKRVADAQWARGLSVQQLFEDGREAIERGVRLALYNRRGGFMAAAVAPTSEVVARGRVGREARPWIVTVYSVDHARLITTYQFGSNSELAIPGDALWLALPPPPTSTGHSNG
jgi:hypothetical protein